MTQTVRKKRSKNEFT